MGNYTNNNYASINLNKDLLKFFTSNANVAYVSDDGYLVAQNAGTAIITVIYNDTMTTAFVVNVSNIIQDLSFSIDEKIVNIGDAFTINPYTTPSESIMNAFKWKSSNTNVAFIDSNGKVITKKPGKTTITAETTDGSQKVAQYDIYVKIGKPSTLKAVVKSKGIKVTWSSVSGATSYAIYRKTAKSGWKKIGNTNELSYLDKGADYNVKYEYCVVAVPDQYSTKYQSEKSVSVSITRKLSAPKIKSIKKSSGKYRIKIKSTGSKTFYIYTSKNKKVTKKKFYRQISGENVSIKLPKGTKYVSVKAVIKKSSGKVVLSKFSKVYKIKKK